MIDLASSLRTPAINYRSQTYGGWTPDMSGYDGTLMRDFGQGHDMTARSDRKAGRNWDRTAETGQLKATLIGQPGQEG
jgi:hypothetical protein